MNNMIFKGVINDETYGNVEDYNNRIKELLEKGEPFNAYTSTQAIEDTPELNSDEIFEIPFINGDCTINYSELHQCKNISDIKSKLKKLIEKNINVLTTFGETDKSNLTTDLDNIEDIIQNTYKSNSDTITEITNEYNDKIYNILQDNIAISVILFYIKLFRDYIKNNANYSGKTTEEVIEEMNSSFDIMTNLFAKLIEKNLTGVENEAEIDALGKLAHEINNCSCSAQERCNCNNNTASVQDNTPKDDPLIKIFKEFHLI